MTLIFFFIWRPLYFLFCQDSYFSHVQKSFPNLRLDAKEYKSNVSRELFCKYTYIYINETGHADDFVKVKLNLFAKLHVKNDSEVDTQ
jgi:hypothetical protein